jgi:hypothetical protein
LHDRYYKYRTVPLSCQIIFIIIQSTYSWYKNTMRLILLCYLQYCNNYHHTTWHYACLAIPFLCIATLGIISFLYTVTAYCYNISSGNFNTIISNQATEIRDCKQQEMVFSSDILPTHGISKPSGRLGLAAGVRCCLSS